MLDSCYPDTDKFVKGSISRGSNLSSREKVACERMRKKRGKDERGYEGWKIYISFMTSINAIRAIPLVVHMIRMAFFE